MDNHRRAVALMVTSAFAFAVMGACVKLAAGPSLWEKVAVRNLVTLFVALGIVLRRRRPILGRRRNQPLLVARSLLGIGGVACYFYALEHLLLADATMLTRLSPFFVAIFAIPFLGEPLRRDVLIGMVCAFIGGLLVIKPRFALDVIPAVVGLGSALFAGGAYTVLRALRNREAPETIVLHFSALSLVVMLPPVFVTFQPPGATDLLWLLGVGLAAAVGQFTLTAAYRYAPAAEVSLYGYSMILFAGLLGLLIWGEVPDALSLLGGVLIIAGGTLVYLRSRSAQAPHGPL